MARTPREERTPQEQIGALVDERLLTLLREAFPSKSPVLGTPVENIWYDSGRVSVVDFIAECMKHAQVARRG